jgi:hypothetical protein
MNGRKNIANIFMIWRVPSDHDNYCLDAVLTTEDTHTHTHTHGHTQDDESRYELTEANNC